MTPPLVSYLILGVFLIHIMVTLFLLYTLMKRYRECKIFVILILFTFYLYAMISIFIEFVPFLINIEDPVNFYLESSNTSVMHFSISGVISAGIFLLFIDYFENDRVSSTNSAIYGFFIGIFIFYLVISSFTDEALVLLAPFSIIFFIYVTITSLRALERIKRATHEDLQKKQVIMMQVVIICYYGLTVLFMTLSYTLDDLLGPELTLFVRHIITRISVIAGDVVIIRAYARTRVAFLQFQRMEKLLVINNAGVLLFSYDFMKPKKRESVDLLFSSGITAVSHLLSEYIGATNIRSIQFYEKQIMINHYKAFIVFLVVDRPSAFLWNALDSFGNMFLNKYRLDNQMTKIIKRSMFDSADDLVKTAFGM